MNTHQLNGLRILNTRPLEQGKALSQAITDAGGIAIEFPTISIEATHADWFSRLPELTQIKQAIFISTNAVNYFFNRLDRHDVDWPSSIQIIAVGKASGEALSMRGLTSHHIPAIADSEHLLALNTLQQIKHQTILLIKGEGGRPLIAETLCSRGAHLVSLPVYRRVLPELSEQYINSLWHDDAVDIILFTSQQSMSNLFTLFGKEAHAWICSKPCVVISERLSKEAALLGMRTIITSRYDVIPSTLKRILHDKQQ